jgi:hypothetical protein
MSALAARAPGGAPAGEFVPYIHGAAPGCPSRGRPEKALAHLKKTMTATGLEDGVPGSDGRQGRVTARNAVPAGLSRNGMPEAGGYVYRGTGQDTGVTAGLNPARLRFEAEKAVAPPARGFPKPRRPSPRLAPAPEPLPEPEPAPVPARRCRKCTYPAGSVGHKTACGDAP